MSGSAEKPRDCIAQLPLRSLIFDTRVKLRHYVDSSSATTAQLGGMRPCPCILTPGQAPSTNAAREGKHVLPNSFYGNGRTKFPKIAERRLSLGSSSPARTAIWNKQPRSRDSVDWMRGSNAALPSEAEVPMVSCNRGWVLLRKLVPICCRDTAPLLRPIPVRPFYEQGAKFTCSPVSAWARRRVFGSEDRCGADRTWDRAGAAQE